MYLEPDDARRVIATCARRLPGGALVFDAVPRWLSERSRSGKLGAPGSWHPPPWTWWIDTDEKRALRESPHIAELRTLRLPRGRGALMGYLPAAWKPARPARGLLLDHAGALPGVARLHAPGCSLMRSTMRMPTRS